MPILHEDFLFPAEPSARNLARRLFASVRDLPIISPHGHTDPAWFAENRPFPDPAHLLVIPDHYVVRMLISQGLGFEQLGIGPNAENDPRKIWRTFAENYHLFRGTPSRLWLDHSFSTLFGIDERLNADNADAVFDTISTALSRPDYTPRALYEKFNIEVIATTDSALDDLAHHKAIRADRWNGLLLPTYRPDAVVDPDYEGFQQNLERLGEMSSCDTSNWAGYLESHFNRRAFFIKMGATATDHGHPTANTQDLPQGEAASLYEKVRSGKATSQETGMLPRSDAY